MYLAITSFIQSNSNINFIISNIKLLALVWSITNYAIQNNCNQYQRIIEATFVCKTFEDAAIQPSNGDFAKQIQFIKVNKLTFYAFN